MKKCIFWIACVVSLVTAGRAADAEISVLETNVLRVEVKQLTENFAEELRANAPSNLLTGIVLDLRFANGTTADDAAAYFAQKKLPLVILVNSQTTGAAAALAAQLHALLPALIIGNTNSRGTILPDIAVAESAADEKTFQENPFAQLAVHSSNALALTNSLMAFVDHTSEADLVRKRIKDGEEDGEFSTPRAEPAQPVIRDPALARAMDVLKALAILKAARG